MATTKQKLEALKEGRELPVDPVALAYMAQPGVDERAVLVLSIVYSDLEKTASVSWENQVKAAEFYNAKGLAATLDEIIRLGGPEYLE